MARIWIDKCIADHDACGPKRPANDGDEETEQKPFFPTRVIDVGPVDGSQESRLVEGEHLHGDYLTLSYRWGDPASITQTRNATLPDYKKRIPFDSLCKTFQDAIKITRKLGKRYIWIDSICIIQDSWEDKGHELAQMADIYENSLFALSASIAESGTSGLIYPRNVINTVEIPIRDAHRKGTGSILISDRILSTFEEDVMSGSLSSRAWCLQERILAPRILHFGQDQTHWECSVGVWSENSSECRTRAQFTQHDDAGDMRQRLASAGPLWNPSRNSTQPEPVSGWRGVTSHEPYGSWYRMVETYTKRNLTNTTDKLPALSGVAKRFAALSKDSYVAGLWTNDLPAGMMWNATGFLGPREQHGCLKRPSKLRAPSWSWASVDGRIHYPPTPFGGIHPEAPAIYIHPSGLDEYGEVDFGMFEVTGHLRMLDTMLGFRTSDKDWVEQYARSLPPTDLIRADFDDPEIGGNTQVYCFLVATRPRGGHELGYGLLLHLLEEKGAFQRVGLAQVWPGDFVTAEKVRIRIL
jgi:hypothetical protein